LFLSYTSLSLGKWVFDISYPCDYLESREIQRGICRKSKKEILYPPSEADYKILVRISVQRIFFHPSSPWNIIFHFKNEST
jgi:hypothetical protein